MKQDFPALWAESPATLRRDPTNGEMANGFPCGPLDLPLWNELMYRLAQVYREASYAISVSGQAPNQNNTTQLWQAMLAAARSVAPDAGSLVHFAQDVSTVGGAISLANVTPAISGLANGYLFEIVPNVTANGAATVSVAGANVPLLNSSGGAIVSGDYIAKRPFIAVYYSGALYLIGPTRSQVGSWASQDPSVLVLTAAGSRSSSAFTAGMPFGNFTGGSTGTVGLPSPYTTVQTIYIDGATYIDATGVVGFRATDSNGSDCRARLIAAGGGLPGMRIGDYLGCRTVAFNQIPCTVGLVLQNLDPTQTVSIQLIIDRTETAGTVQVYDPRISARHNGSV